MMKSVFLQTHFRVESDTAALSARCRLLNAGLAQFVSREQQSPPASKMSLTFIGALIDERSARSSRRVAHSRG